MAGQPEWIEPVRQGLRYGGAGEIPKFVNSDLMELSTNTEETHQECATTGNSLKNSGISSS